MTVNCSIVFRSAFLVILFSCSASMVRADNDSNSFTEQVKEAAKRSGEWIKEKREAIREWRKETWQKGKALSDERFGTSFTQKSDMAERGRKVVEQPKESDLPKLEVPWNPDETKLTGQEPIKRGGPVVTTEEIGGEPVEMTSIDLQDSSSSFEWLSSDEAKLYGAGALAIITIAGVSYVLYKNGVPQRIYGYVAKNPVKSAITAACVLGIAAFVAHQQGVTVESVKNMFTAPTAA